MKKLLALLLCIGLLASLSVQALAANSADSAMTDRLKAVTLKVKETLGIGDSFTTFNGNLNETGTSSLWSLSWSSEREQIYVTANENGTIVNYSDSVPNVSVPPAGRIPRFPALSLDDAKTIAEAFLAKVLDTTFMAVGLTGTSALDYSGNAMYYMNGTLKLNGIDSPVSVGISVSALTKQVASFYRNDAGQDYSGVTKPSAAGDKAAAAAALKGTLNMRMVYALPGDGTHTARLQYTPHPDGSYVVDAVTGKLVDLSKLDFGPTPYPLMKNALDTGSSPSGGASITPTEQASIDKLQGILPQSELEKTVRSYPELGLSDSMKLQSANYYTYEDEQKETHVTASLQFTSAQKDDNARYLSVSMDAKTGKLISVGGNIIYADTKTGSTGYPFDGDQTLAVAKAFAGKILPDEMAQTVLSDEADGQTNIRNYTFLRAHDGVTFPENYISVGVDAKTGFVVSFYYNWYGYEVTFASKSGAITADAAAVKFSEGTGTALRYVAVPASLQPSGLLLAFAAADTSVWGVNALTGDLLKATATAADTGIKYDDIDGNPYAAFINKLASYGVGFPGGSFKPDSQLTQQDALAFIESTTGRKVTPLPPVITVQTAGAAVSADSKTAAPIRPSETDDIYTLAYSMGILTPDEKDPAKAVSRAEFARYLVNALGYKEVATLTGIFAPGFQDDRDIPAGLEGYVAIAKGLGIVRGDQTGSFRPNDTATRTMAAVMLYNCMSRK